MKIDINPLLGAVGASFEVDLTEKLFMDLGEDFEIKGPVTLKGTITNTGMGLIAKGKCVTTVLMECAICLKVFEEKLSLDFEERFIDESQAFFPPDKDHEIQEDDIYFTYSSDLSLDFSEMIREIIILNLPIAPKCDINCQVKEQEQKKTINPRLAVLAKLKKKTEDCNGCTKEENN